MRRRPVQFDVFELLRTWAARNMGISGLGTNPTNPWCQHPRRPPPKYKTQPQDWGPAIPGGSVKARRRGDATLGRWRDHYSRDCFY